MKKRFYIFLSIFLSSCFMMNFCAKSSHHEANVQKTASLQLHYIVATDPPPNKVEKIASPTEHLQSSRASRSRTRYSQGTVGNVAIEACIVAREHGGSYTRGNNPTHTGKYQFSYKLWVANGGNPNTWENASPQEQETVFRTTVNQSGYSNWRPYDGC